MRSMVEGAATTAAPGIRPLHRLRRSPSPARRGRNPKPLRRSGALMTPSGSSLNPGIS